MHRSYRQWNKKQSRCANCNVYCLNQRSFSSQLPNLGDDFNFAGEQRPDHERDEQYQWTRLINQGKTIGKKPQFNPDGHDQYIFSNSEDGVKMTILEALIEIFHLNWNYHPDLLRSTKKRRYSLVMCRNCSYYLSQMYDGYQKFIKSTLQSKSKSYLSPLLFSEVPDYNVAEDIACKTTNSELFEELDDRDLVSRSNDSGGQGILGRVKTSYKGDLKYLISCKVQVTKLTSQSAKILARRNGVELYCMPEGSFEIDDKLTKIEPTPTFDNSTFDDAGDDEDFVLSSVKYESDNAEITSKDNPVKLPTTNIPRRRPGRPGKHELSLTHEDKVVKVTSKGSKVTTCSHCGKILKSKLLLCQHVRLYHQEQYDCPYCTEKQSDHRQLKIHLNSVHGNLKTESCDVCGKTFFTVTELRKHGIVHYDKKTVTCHFCNGIFPSVKHLKAHQLTHTEGDARLPAYVCPIVDCGKRYISAQLLHNHVRYLHDRRNYFVCTYRGCDKSFGTESYLNAHIVSHESTGTHLCEQCGKNYKHKKDLRIHERRNHSTVGPDELKKFPCTICPKRYFRADHLRIHRVKANHYIGGQEPELPDSTLLDLQVPQEFMCSTCNKQFQSDMALKSHELTHIDKEDAEVPREHACVDCNLKYSNLKALEYHQRYMHKLKGAFACSFCSKSFGRLSSFKRHLMVHSGSQHICGNCNKSYKNKVDLMHHMRREHVMTEKNYEHECESCDKRFYRRDMLRTHLVKTGHVARKKLPLDVTTLTEGQDQLNNVVYVVESSDFLKSTATHLEMEMDETRNELVLVRTEEEEEEEQSEVVGTNLETVEITGEDGAGAIARVVMVDSEGTAEEVDTEVVTLVGGHDGEHQLIEVDLDGMELPPGTLAAYRYSIQLE